MKIVNAFSGQKIPSPESVDVVFIMGGPMSVHNEDDYPWIIAEKCFVEKVINNGKAGIGIFIGAQLIADVLRAKVFKMNTKEIGWYEVEKLSSENSISKILPKKFMAFHWYGEIFDIPCGASHIAFNNFCANQGFALNGKIIGLQFHIEITPQGVYDLIQNCSYELNDNGHVQSKYDIINGVYHCNRMNKILDAILNEL